MSFLDQAKKDEKKAVVRVLEIDSDGQFEKEELGFGVKMKKDEKSDCFFIITSSSVLRSLLFVSDGSKIVVDRYCSQYPSHKDNEDHRSEVYKVEISSEDEDVSFVLCKGGRREEFLDVYEEFLKERHRRLFAYAFDDKEMIQLVFENKSSNDDYKLKEVSKKGFHVRRAKGAPIIVYDPISEEPKVVGIVGVKKNGDLYPVFLTKNTFALRTDHPKEQEDASSFASEKKDDGSLKSCTDEAKGLDVDASLGCDVTDRAIHPADLQGKGKAPLIVTGLTGTQKGKQLESLFSSKSECIKFKKISKALPQELINDLQYKLDPDRLFGGDISSLASEFGYNNERITYLKTFEFKTKRLLQQEGNTDLKTLRDMLQKIQRDDAAALIDDFIKSNCDCEDCGNLC